MVSGDLFCRFFVYLSSVSESIVKDSKPARTSGQSPGIQFWKSKFLCSPASGTGIAGIVWNHCHCDNSSVINWVVRHGRICLVYSKSNV